MRFLAAAVLPLLIAAAPPAGVPQKELTIERVFDSPSLSGAVPRLPKLSPDGRYLALLRNRPDDLQRYDLWAFDREAGQWSMLVDSQKLGAGQVQSEAEKMQRERKGTVSLKGIVDLRMVGGRQVDPRSAGRRALLSGSHGTVRQVTGTGKGDTLNPVLSETGKYLSFVRDNRLWVGPVGGLVKPITPSQGSLVHWGEAEFIAQEELHRYTGYWWSPKDTRIAVERFDEAPVDVLTRAAIGAAGTTTYQQRYPAAGRPNAKVSLFVVDPNGGRKVEVDLGPNRDVYLAGSTGLPTEKASTSSG